MELKRSFFVLLVCSFAFFLMGAQPISAALAPAGFVKVSPGNGATNQPSATGVVLTWSASSTPNVTYEYCVWSKANCPTSKWVKVGSATKATVLNLSPNTVYYWQVRARDASNAFTYADGQKVFWSFKTQPNPGQFNKLAPAHLSTGQAANGLLLRWGASANADRYEYCIDRQNDNTCNTTWVSAGNATSVTVSGLSANAVHYWQVRAVNGSGTVYANAGAWWSFSTQVLPGAFSKTAPADNATNLPVNNLQLSWNSTSDAVSYEYCYDSTNNNQCDTTWTSVGNSTSAVIHGLVHDKLYYWQVRAVGPGGATAANNGAWWIFRTQLAPPGPFTKTNPVNGAVSLPANVTLTWGASAGAASYEYCYDTTNNNTCDGAWISSGTSTSSPTLTLSYGTTYYWQVRAINTTAVVEANNGVWWVLNTRIAPPGSFTKTGPANNASNVSLHPTLSWSASTGLNITYEYCFDTIKNATCDTLWNQAGPATTAQLSGLQYDTTYFWQVRATNNSGMTYADGAATWYEFKTESAPPQPFGKAGPANGAAQVVTTPFLSWSTSAGAEQYEYCIDQSDDTICDTGWVNVDLSASVKLLPLNNGETYYWQVRAVRPGMPPVEADNGAWWRFDVIVTPPAGFSKINPIKDAKNQLTSPWLFWTASADAESYEYCYDDDLTIECEGGWVNVGNSTSAQLTGLAHNQTYYWQVRAVKTGVEPSVADSGEWYAFTTLVAPPAVIPGENTFTTNEDTLLEKSAAQLKAHSASGAPLLYWLYGPEPAGALNLSVDGRFSYMPEPNFYGEVTFQFMVSDGLNVPQGPFDAKIEVKSINDKPVLAAIPNQVIKTNQTVTLYFTASDPDQPYGDTLTLSIQGTLPPGASFDASTGTFSWTPVWSPTHPEPYSFTVVATDTQGPAADQKVFTIAVTPETVFTPILMRQ